MDKPFIVFVKTNESGYITAVNSSAFLADTADWVEIDSGYGDKYHHAQGHYFPEPITTDGGAYRYKLIDGVPVECTPEEIAEQEAALNPDPEQPEEPANLESRVETLETDSTEMKLAIDALLGVSE